MLVEIAWHYQHSPRVSPIIAARQDQLPQAITDIAWAAQLRLSSKFKRLLARRELGQSAEQRHPPSVTTRSLEVITPG